MNDSLPAQLSEHNINQRININVMFQSIAIKKWQHLKSYAVVFFRLMNVILSFSLF